VFSIRHRIKKGRGDLEKFAFGKFSDESYGQGQKNMLY
jgi:hypothetical protein